METPNTDYNDINELNDLRQQLNDLKNKVNQQGYLNESLVKMTIRGKMTGVHHTIMLLAVATMLCIPLFIWMKYEQNLSWALTTATIVMMLGSLISDYFINRIDVRHMGDDMVETARKLTQMKANRGKAHRISLTVALLWLLWFIFEFYNSQLALGVQTARLSVIILFAGATIGAILGVFIYHKMQRANDEMIEQINDLTHQQ